MDSPELQLLQTKLIKNLEEQIETMRDVIKSKDRIIAIKDEIINLIAPNLLPKEKQ